MGKTVKDNNESTIVGGIVIGNNNTIINCPQVNADSMETKYLKLMLSLHEKRRNNLSKKTLIFLIKMLLNEKK